MYIPSAKPLGSHVFYEYTIPRALVQNSDPSSSSARECDGAFDAASTQPHKYERPRKGDPHLTNAHTLYPRTSSVSKSRHPPLPHLYNDFSANEDIVRNSGTVIPPAAETSYIFPHTSRSRAEKLYGKHTPEDSLVLPATETSRIIPYTAGSSAEKLYEKHTRADRLVLRAAENSHSIPCTTRSSIDKLYGKHTPGDSLALPTADGVHRTVRNDSRRCFVVKDSNRSSVDATTGNPGTITSSVHPVAQYTRDSVINQAAFTSPQGLNEANNQLDNVLLGTTDTHEAPAGSSFQFTSNTSRDISLLLSRDDISALLDLQLLADRAMGESDRTATEGVIGTVDFAHGATSVKEDNSCDLISSHNRSDLVTPPLVRDSIDIGMPSRHEDFGSVVQQLSTTPAPHRESHDHFDYITIDPSLHLSEKDQKQLSSAERHDTLLGPDITNEDCVLPTSQPRNGENRQNMSVVQNTGVSRDRFATKSHSAAIARLLACLPTYENPSVFPYTYENPTQRKRDPRVLQSASTQGTSQQNPYVHEEKRNPGIQMADLAFDYPCSEQRHTFAPRRVVYPYVLTPRSRETGTVVQRRSENYDRHQQIMHTATVVPENTVSDLRARENNKRSMSQKSNSPKDARSLLCAKATLTSVSSLARETITDNRASISTESVQVPHEISAHGFVTQQTAQKI